MEYQFVVKLDGEGVREGLVIDAEKLVDGLKDFILFSHRIISYNNLIPKDISENEFHLYITKFEDNCFANVLEFKPRPTLNNYISIESPWQKAARKIYEGLKAFFGNNRKYFLDNYKISWERANLFKALRNMFPKGKTRSTIIVRKNKENILSCEFTPQFVSLANQWIELEKKETPKLVAKWKGSELVDDKIKIKAWLLSGELINFKFPEDSFKNLEFLELFRIYGDYNREPGKNTLAEITNVDRYHSIQDEFDVSEEQYIQSFSDDPEYEDLDYQKMVNLGYEVYKKNFPVLKLLGED